MLPERLNCSVQVVIAGLNVRDVTDNQIDQAPSFRAISAAC